jgi:hypothetical protein
VTQIIRASGVYTYGYSTYLGGSDGDWGFGIAVSANGMGHAYVTGGTASSDFPTCNAIATTLGGDIDAFVTKITTDATSPAVVAVAPGSGAADVALTAPVVVTFSEPINTSTFAYNVTPDPGGWSAAWSGGDTAVTLAHDPFASQTTYTVTVTAATDLGGNPLAGAPYAWHFTTVSYRLYLPLVVRSYQ